MLATTWFRYIGVLLHILYSYLGEGYRSYTEDFEFVIELEKLRFQRCTSESVTFNGIIHLAVLLLSFFKRDYDSKWSAIPHWRVSYGFFVFCRSCAIMHKETTLKKLADPYISFFTAVYFIN